MQKKKKVFYNYPLVCICGHNPHFLTSNKFLLGHCKVKGCLCSKYRPINSHGLLDVKKVWGS